MSSKSNTIEGVRLDKWLWAARFYKTRSVARNMVDGGKVHYNGQRAKPSKIIDLGAEVKLRQGNNEEITVIVEIISDQRRGAPVAQTLYKETQSSIERREENAKLRKLNSLGSPHPDKRPDKKQRRDIMKFKQQ
ncbi:MULTISPECIES: ribosome-associated heat shock protein Hsp15 [Aliivibrio]|jgi:ribosome-associated heat shock protein Hsp15|uniref:Heat shock protein 15 n=3 Tax=Aliivibrio TaxID=511678 RepID=A0A1B9NV69_ALILO|nr:MULTISPECIES: ribosome-associated heat shock protein Hsp15 [Aliivibrio]AZL85994.1 ribosome-associated heat shock protein Hsp15 [Aliivibrio salmonicida]MBB1313333.1 ribosome-associated heat shock protein Hsp15 [Aliivibrio sp. SR45-2]OCH18411.1 heat-shock protein [Aliivibrio logei]OEF09679.1 heat-shock protein [Aliivibrio logei 5S-186]CAQ80610.1 heat shock protein 15 [Aliivibrio salmonicida LFI1238]